MIDFIFILYFTIIIYIKDNNKNNTQSNLLITFSNVLAIIISLITLFGTIFYFSGSSKIMMFAYVLNFIVLIMLISNVEIHNYDQRKIILTISAILSFVYNIIHFYCFKQKYQQYQQLKKTYNDKIQLSENEKQKITEILKKQKTQYTNLKEDYDRRLKLYNSLQQTNEKNYSEKKRFKNLYNTQKEKMSQTEEMEKSNIEMKKKNETLLKNIDSLNKGAVTWEELYADAQNRIQNLQLYKDIFKKTCESKDMHDLINDVDNNYNVEKNKSLTPHHNEGK